MARGRKVDAETKKRVQKGVSDTKKAWDTARQVANQPMGPGQSLAMAGNTGLAGFSENQAEQIKQAKQTTQDFFDQNKGQKSDPVSFKDIGQEIGEIGSKYRRPVDFLKTAQKAAMFNQGIAGGGKIVVGPDGIPRLQFGNQVVRDPITGAQMASMFLPRTFAEQPSNLGQFFGDVGRAFSGYDSLKYPDQNFQGPFPVDESSNLPYMQRTPGMFEGINPLSLIPGVGTAMKIGEGIKGVYDFMFPKPPVVNYGGSSDITVTEEPIQTAPNIFLPTQGYDSRGYLPEGFSNVGIEQPQFPYNFETVIKPKPLTNEILPTNLNEEDFKNTYPYLYDSRLQDLPFKAKPNISNQNDFQTALANARVENTGVGLDSLKAAYEFARNPSLNTKYGNFSLNDVLTGDPTLGYQTDVFGGQLGLTAQPNQLGFTFTKAFKNGGRVDKHSGLGYMLK